MVAKTFQGLEDILAEELRDLGALNVQPGRRMVEFEGNLEMLYRANMCCRTALRILKPLCSFEARNPDELYDRVKEMPWEDMLSVDKTFAIDSTVYSDEFTHSRYVTYRVKDAIVDRFQDRLGAGKRPGVRLHDADVMLNVHISGTRVTLSLDSSGESLHKRGWRVAQTEAPINEVLAAGIILMTGWDGDKPFVDPMCGSGTFAIEAAMIAAGIYPGIYRKHYAFENWADFDADLLEKIYNDDSAEREVTVPIIACDIDKRALEIAKNNAKSAGVERYITFERRSIAFDAPEEIVPKWNEAGVPAGVIVTNPPYGKRISVDDMNALYKSIGATLKHVFTDWDVWIIGYTDEYFNEIGLAPSKKLQLYNGGLECELREYMIFAGKKKEFRQGGGRIKDERPEAPRKDKDRGPRDRKFDKDSGDRRPRKFDRDDKGPRGSRESREGREGRERRDFRSPKAPGQQRTEGRWPLSLGRQPSISADKEIVVNRPVWRTRKKHNNDNTETDKTNE